MHVTSDRLTLHQLARLLKVMSDYAYAHPEATTLEKLLEAVAQEQALTLTREHRGQIYGAASMVTLGPDARVSSVGEALEPAFVITALDQNRDPLSALLWNAWNVVLAAAKQEPAELVLMETGGLLVPDPRNKDLDGLSIAELLFLVAHDKLDGRALLAAPVLACGVAAGILAELLLRELITVDPSTHLVRAEGELARTVPGIAEPVRRALSEIQDGEPAALGAWLTALSTIGLTAVRRQLLESGVVVREVRGRFGRKTYYRAVGEVVDSIFRVATRPLAVGRDPTPPCAVLIELAKATRLTAARYGEWIHVHGTDPAMAFAGASGSGQLELLLALTRAEVTDQLTRP